MTACLFLLAAVEGGAGFASLTAQIWKQPREAVVSHNTKRAVVQLGLISAMLNQYQTSPASNQPYNAAWIQSSHSSSLYASTIFAKCYTYHGRRDSKRRSILVRT